MWEPWITGFERAMQLRPEAWEATDTFFLCKPAGISDARPNVTAEGSDGVACIGDVFEAGRDMVTSDRAPSAAPRVHALFGNCHS